MTPDDARKPAVLEGAERHQETAAELCLYLSEEAHEAGTPVERVYLNGVQLDRLADLLETGLYGSTRAQVIVRILDQALEESLVRGLLSSPDPDLETLRP